VYLRSLNASDEMEDRGGLYAQRSSRSLES
jgi:hypothetical protein